MSKLVRKSHNVSELLYHYVYTAKYRRLVYDQTTDEILNKVCLEIAKRYQIEFIELGTDKGHVHFLLQSTPRYSPTQIIQTVKRLTVREIFKQAPDVKQKLWGGEYWSDGFYISTVGRQGSEDTNQKYEKEPGKEDKYQQLHGQQLNLFE